MFRHVAVKRSEAPTYCCRPEHKQIEHIDLVFYMHHNHAKPCRVLFFFSCALIMFSFFFFSLLWRSGTDEVACLVKDIVDCTTGRHLAFVCTTCTTPFLYPSLATIIWLASMAALSEADQDAHRVGASLLMRTNKRYHTTRSTGVVLGECNRCYAASRSPVRAAVKGQGFCQSVRHKTGSPTLARYVPGPGIIPWLWTAEKAALQVTLSTTERDKVCPGCRSGSERAARVAGASGVPSGLEMLAAAAAAQPVAPLREVGRVSGVSVVPVKPVASMLTSCVQTVAVAPKPPLVNSLEQLMDLLERYDSLGPAELVLFEKLMAAHLRATKPNEFSLAFKNGVNR